MDATPITQDGVIEVGLTVGPAGYSGIGTYARELAVALHRRDDVALTVIGCRRAIDEISEAIGAHRPPPKRLELSGSRIVESGRIVVMSRAMRRREIAIVHGTRQVIPLRWSGPTVLTFHDDYVFTRTEEYDRLKRVLLPAVYRRSLKRANAVLTSNSATKVTASSYTGAGVAVTNAGAAVPTRLKTAQPEPPSPFIPSPFALVVGDAGPRKRVDSLLDSWATVDQRCGVGLVIAGGRALSDSLLARIRAAENQGIVHLVQSPSEAHLAWLYTNAELVVDASDAEGFGFPAVEAEHFGIPYLTLRAKSSNGHDEQYAERIVEALETDTPTRRSEDAATTSWDEVADRTVAVYRSVLSIGAQ